MSFGNTLENKMLDHFIGATVYTAEATVYIGLSRDTVGDDIATNSEPFASGNGYARVAQENNVTNFPAAAAGLKRNANALTYPECSSDWGTITHFSVWNHPSSANENSNFLAHGALNTSKLVSQGDTPRFPVDSLSFSLD